ncbi:TetR/AcrR family transcriptional regulator [Candidatus Cloacimonadota bacterium]
MEVKERIIKTALRIFMIKGYEAASMSDVVAETQLSKGGIYHHFKNKKDLFLQCIDHMFNEFEKWEHEMYAMNMEVKEILRTYLGSLGVIQDFVNQITDSKDASIDSFYKLMMDAFLKFPEIKETHFRTHEHNMNHLIELLKQAQQDGVIKPEVDCSTLGFMINAMAEGTILYHILNERLDLNKMGNKIFETLWNGIST